MYSALSLENLAKTLHADKEQRFTQARLAYQIERYADIYTSRVSNFLRYTPFVYLRSPRGSLPHDSGEGGGV